MIQIRTSYFYQIRFFKSNMIPVSTAVWDPLWYHNNSHNKRITYVDKRGIINGVRNEQFMPGDTCRDLCRGPETCSAKDHSKCDFLKKYSEQLDQIDISDLMKYLEILGQYYKNQLGFYDDPIIVFIVHEAPTNACSERKSIQEYFIKNGVHCQELNYPIGGVK